MLKPVLIVDDNPHNLQVLARQIQDAGWKVAIAKNGRAAIEQAVHNPPVLILLDVIMPDLDGFATCQQLKSLPETKDIPIIFMTALDDTANKVKGLSIGGVDYITKPFQGEEVLARINLHCQLYFLSQKLERQNQELEKQVKERTEELRASLARLQESQECLKRSFEEVKRAKELAEASDRAKSEFLGNMSHEFFTPLNAIIGYSDLLTCTETHLPTQVREGLQTIYDAGQQLLKLLRNTLTLADASTDDLKLDWEVFSIEQLLEQSKEEWQFCAEKNNNKLEIKCKDIGKIYSDREKVCQILDLLLDNACKFTREGKIRVCLSQRPENSSVAIAIEDTGIGIAEDQISRIFLPFVQVDGSMSRQYNGAGLGLAIAQNLIQQIGAEIEVKSAVGSGSTFTVVLPLDISKN